MSSLIVLRAEPGQEVVASFTDQARSAGIVTGAIVSLVGAVDACCISNMPADDAKADVLTEYSQPFELSGSGEIVDGRVHLHVTLSGAGDRALHGHLHRADVSTWYVAAYVLPV